MALLNLEAVEKYKNLYTGYTVDTPNGVKAVMAMKQPGNPIKRSNLSERHRSKHRKGWWPEEKKLEAASLYAALGNYERVAALTKIPHQTIRRWATEDWFLQIQQRVKRDENHEADRRLTTIVDKAFDAIEERIDNGDRFYDIRRGTIVNVPMSGRDLGMTAGVLFDKRQLLRGEATKITASVNSEEHLKALADKFAAFVKAKTEKVVEEVPPQIEFDSEAG